MAKKYYVEADLDAPYEDCGQFRTYRLDTEGDSLVELLDNAQIFEVDEDGGDVGNFMLYDSGTGPVIAESELVIAKAFIEKVEEKLIAGGW
jgi:hypothetical protein